MFLACSAWAQSKRVTVKPPERIIVKAGAAASQATHVSIQPGSHVNSNKPRSEFLIPLSLEWEPGALTVSALHYPNAEELQVGPDKLLVYTGDFTVTTDFKAASNAMPGNLDLRGKLHFQACNTQMCFRPATVDVHPSRHDPIAPRE